MQSKSVRPCTVSEVNKYIKDIFDKEDSLRNICVEGEISNFKTYASGHSYFSLKDATGVLKCVFFKFRAASLSFQPHNGDSVIALGRISVYERDGVYQLYVDRLLNQGVGNLMLWYEQLKDKLTQDGLFLPERKRELPFNPQSVGIVTSQSGAVVHDIIRVARRRNPGIKLYLFPAQVQGTGASQEIVRGIRFFNAQRLVDVLIVGRGGGSLEDLWAFNEEATVRAVAGSKLPVISAVGHDTDFTLCDFAADKRAATPSQAAELAVANVAELRDRLDNYLERARGALRRNFEQFRERWQRSAQARVLREPLSLYEFQEQRLTQLRKSRVLSDPRLLYENKEQSLDMTFARLLNIMQQRRQRWEQRLAVASAKLATISPYEVFKRGYSYTKNAQDELISSVEQIAWGDELVTVLRDGVIRSVVQEVERR
jgi:exodeoxyribonuclease VII large subunit